MIEIFKETFQSLFSKLTLTIWVIATLGAVLAGPFGTFESMDIQMRALYWPAITTSSIMCGYFSYALTRVLFGMKETLLSRLIAGLIGTLLIASDVYAVSRWGFGIGHHAPNYLSLLLWVGFVFYSVILARMVFDKAVEDLSKKNAPSPIQIVIPEAIQTPVRETRLLKRLPDGNHIRILRLTANDHFVHVQTEAGDYPIRMRLRDAILEMDGVEGFLVHRSHWVARSAMVSVERDNGKLSVVLTAGDRVPVSRNYRADVEAIGLIETPPLAKTQSEASALSQ
jgi:hypothetical protein